MSDENEADIAAGALMLAMLGAGMPALHHGILLFLSIVGLPTTFPMQVIAWSTLFLLMFILLAFLEHEAEDTAAPSADDLDDA